MKHEEWDENTELVLGKYIRFPICKLCYDKIQNQKEKLSNIFETKYNGNDIFISDSYYRGDWDQDFCFFCFIREITK